MTATANLHDTFNSTAHPETEGASTTVEDGPLEGDRDGNRISIRCGHTSMSCMATMEWVPARGREYPWKLQQFEKPFLLLEQHALNADISRTIWAVVYEQTKKNRSPHQ